MGRPARHPLTEIDRTSKTATCDVCGPVAVYVQGDQVRCAEMVKAGAAKRYEQKREEVLRQQRDRYREQHPEPTQHSLSEIDPESLTAHCSVHGERVKIQRDGTWKGQQLWRCAPARYEWEKDNPRRKEYQAEYRQRPGYAEQAKVRARTSWLKRYGLTLEQYEKMLSSQDYKCALCRKPCDTGQRLAVDHDSRCCPPMQRSCGKCIRGLICMSCNRAMGLFKHDTEVMLRAIDYLERTTAPPAEADGAAETTR